MSRLALAALIWITLTLAVAETPRAADGPGSGWHASRLSAITAADIACDPAARRPFYARASDTIYLPAAYCRVLIERQVDWVTAYVTFILAHELGHRAAECAASEADCEDGADCYAAGHLRSLARRFGRAPAEIRYMVRVARAGFGYRPIPAPCWPKS